MTSVIPPQGPGGPRDRVYFFERLERERIKADHAGPGYSTYGSNVLPVLQLYKGLGAFDERKAFQDALEQMLGDDDEQRRHFAVNVCLGFFVFRDAI